MMGVVFCEIVVVVVSICMELKSGSFGGVVAILVVIFGKLVFV